MKRVLCICLLVSLMISLVACKGQTVQNPSSSGSSPTVSNPTDIPVEKPVENPVENPVETPNVNENKTDISELSYNVHLFSKLMEDEELIESSFCVSPYSLKQALLLAYVGAENGSDTQKELGDLLDLIDNGKVSVHEFERDNRVILTSSKAAKFKVANVALFDDSLIKSPDFDNLFVKPLNDYYNAAVELADLQDNSIVEKVNEFVNDNTEGTISELIKEPFSDDAKLVLLNAVYFLGNWQTPFDEYSTVKDKFKGLNGSFDIDFMNDTRTVKYFENDKIKSISLEYESDKNTINAPTFEMSFYLPVNNKTDIVELYNSLTDSEKEVFFDTKEYSYSETIVKLPKFELDTELKLLDVLKAMGMTKAVDRANKDFSNIADCDKYEGFYISDVIQKTYIKVDEKGTEASAVTGVMAGGIDSVQEKPKYKEFIADRPFIYVVRDINTDTILFMGIMTNN